MGGIDMRQEDKELILKDLCARLPYNVICQVEFKESGKYKSEIMLLSGIFTDEAYFTAKGGSIYSNEYKPYLFPLSSITEEQTEELINLINTGQNDNNEFMRSLCRIEFYHKHHFDYMGLIPMGLAIDATGLNIY